MILHDGMVAILPVRKDSESINHAICILDADAANLVGIDYPKLRVTYTAAELAEIWDGEALLLRRRIPIWRRAIEVLPGVIVGFGIVFVRKCFVQR